MGYVIGCIIILGVLLSLMLSISLLSGKKFEQIAPVVILGIIALLYVFGSLRILLVGVYFILFLAAIGFSYIIYRIYKDRLNFFKENITPGFIILLFLYVIVCIILRNSIISRGDDYAAWGLMARIMFLTNELHTVPDVVFAYVAYPPGTTIFQYFSVYIARQGFLEAYIFIAYYIFLYVLLTPLLQDFKWKDCKKIVGPSIFILFTPVMFNHMTGFTIYADVLLGALFGYILYSYYKYGISKFNIINLSLALSVLVLMKRESIVFAGFAIFIMGIDYLFFHRKTEKKVNKLMLAIPILVVVLTFLSWELNKGLVSYEIIETVDIEEHITSFINFDFMPHQREIIRSFPEVMNERGLLYNRMVNVSTVGIVGYGIVGLMLYLTINKEKDNKRVIVNFLTIAFCFISYVMFLVVLYLFVFPLYEASLYPSFSRYILPFIIAIAMLVMGFMIKNITTKQNRDAIAYSVILVTLVIMLTDISIIRTLFDGEISGYDRRRSAEYRASIIKDNTDLQSRIWFWSFGVNRASRNDTIFLAYPHRIASREWCFNLPDDTETGDRARRFSTMPAGLPYGETAEYTVGYTPYEIKEILYNEFDYVFLHGIMEEFIYNFKGVFENPDEITWRSLYKVVRGEEMQDTRLRRVAK